MISLSLWIYLFSSSLWAKAVGNNFWHIPNFTRFLPRLNLGSCQCTRQYIQLIVNGLNCICLFGIWFEYLFCCGWFPVNIWSWCVRRFRCWGWWLWRLQQREWEMADDDGTKAVPVPCMMLWSAHVTIFHCTHRTFFSSLEEDRALCCFWLKSNVALLFI